ncbi:hypothetical protein C7447_1028 [Tenacibaculum adriaticum]|uniref:Uncharacterized protein n=1 Tax=Tenacibaculum adriaticum TaxID=413713 RepID=A0A5S5DRZ4_9FLAO|nr:hypothetical protein [Tenacibaculum adriaticum]TYP98693.1 hypothetical protein C7447_1028 [Tenacibaculum adriaticum]
MNVLNNYRLYTTKLLFIFICFFAVKLYATDSLIKSNPTKGLFTIQFSWNSDSYARNVSVQVEYKKKGFLKKKKTSGETAFHAIKNQFITLELSEGEYELLSVRLTGGKIGYGKFLRIPLEGTFNIKKEQVTNGGMIYLIRENESSNKVMALPINNTEDVKRYVRQYKSEYANQIASMQSAWKFLSNDKVDKLVTSFAELLVSRHNAKPNTKVTHLYATLGMVIKMKKDKNGKVINYKLINTPTYQQIKKMTLKKDNTIICTLENGSFLYGTEEGLEYMPLPSGLESAPELQSLKGNKFLLADNSFNIFWADSSFKWKSQLEFRKEQKAPGFFSLSAIPYYPKIYNGKKHLYIYSSNSEKYKILLQSEYDNIHFTSVPLAKKVKKITKVTETPTHLIIGPHLKLNATAKRPGYLYVKKHDSEEWNVRDLPRGDCKRFFPGKDENIWYTECSKNNWLESKDYGVSWSKWKAPKKEK